MAIPVWLRRFPSAFSRRSCARFPRKTPPRARPCVHVLEDRVLPSAYVVTTTADSGPGSLRDAITQVNADTSHVLYASPSNPNVDEIDFNITSASDTGGGFNAKPLTGASIITLHSPLPAITNATLLDATTEPGYGQYPIIELDGTSAGSGDGLTLQASNSTVRGFIIEGFRGNGITVQGGTGNLIVNNFIGSDDTGFSPAGNAGDGILLTDGAHGNTIGGTVIGTGANGVPPSNLIAYNGLDGVAVVGSSTTGNYIRGNEITNNAHLGIDLGGTGTPVPNDSLGHNGPNRYQDYPVIPNAAINASGDLMVSYAVPTADTSATYPLTIDFYLADTTGQGAIYLATDTYSATDLANGVKSVDLGSVAALANNEGNLTYLFTGGFSAGSLLVATVTDAADNTSEFSPVTALIAPTLTTTPGGTVGLGSGAQLTASATLTGAYNPTGTITFTLYAFHGTSALDVETVSVNGNGTYSTRTGYLPSATGTYQWVASYSGDGNNSPSSSALTTLASFNANTGHGGGLIADAGGNLYGTTTDGGTYGAGSVFELARGGSAITTLASFSGSPNGGGRSVPAGLVIDSSGNLYGRNVYGGPSDQGTVFELAAGSGTITTLASFNGSNGRFAFGGLVMDSNGNLYGRTGFGGTYGGGTIFELAAGSSTTTTLVSLDSDSWHFGISLILDSSGNLFGTASGGGAYGDGTIFELAAGSGTITTLASFNGNNGAGPNGLVMDSSGNLYGSTSGGGAYGDGAIFELAAGSGTIAALASFDGSNGLFPRSGLVMDSSGNLFGTTMEGPIPSSGGAFGTGCGTIFELAAGSGAITTLASFNGSNGALPGGGLVIDSSGNLYGIGAGGPGGFGVLNMGSGIIFELKAATETVKNSALTNVTSSASTSVFGQMVTFTATVSSAAGTPTGSVDFFDTTTNTDLGTVTLTNGSAALAMSALSVDSHAVTATYSGDATFAGSSASITQTVNAVTAANLQQTLSPSNPVTIVAATAQQAHDIFVAANGLNPASTPTATLIVDLSGQTVQDTIVNVPSQVTVTIINGTFIGGSPALVVGSGTVIVRDSLFTNATNAPTILVTGGKLILRNDTIQESTGFSQVGIEVTGGTVDLGTAAAPGGNTLNINGAGAFVHNTTSNPVAAVGDVFLVNGTPLAPASLSGLVFEDFNDDGQVDFGEKGIGGVTITLTGRDDLGSPVNLTRLTDADGAYLFLNLRPGDYSITETQPGGYLQGINTVGTAGGSLAALDRFFVQLAAATDGLNYNFGERPAATGAVQHGQTAGIGFWNNKNGQALIKSFNGGTGTQLGNWLAVTLPHIFGVYAGGNNLAGKGNAYVAALFQQDFLMKGVKLDAQVLATALSVYATNATLDATGVAVQYGFTVSGSGVGTAAVSVGSAGDAFGVANNTTMTVLDLLLATDDQSVNGLLYNGNVTKRQKANDLFSAINQAGNIG